MFKSIEFKESKYPPNFIPKDARAIICVDPAGEKDSTVKGFMINGEFHIQEVNVNE